MLPLLLIMPVQLVLAVTERWFPASAVIVATSEVPTEVCIVPTANLLVSALFDVCFIAYFNLICVRMSHVVISRHIKWRLWTLQMWHTVSLPVIVVLRLLLIIGFGFASRHEKSDLFSEDAFFSSGLLFSRFMVDIQFFFIVVSALLSVHALVWRPLREVDRLSAVHGRQLVLEVEASRVEASAGPRGGVQLGTLGGSSDSADAPAASGGASPGSSPQRGRAEPRVRLRFGRAVGAAQQRAGVPRRVLHELPIAKNAQSSAGPANSVAIGSGVGAASGGRRVALLEHVPEARESYALSETGGALTQPQASSTRADTWRASPARGKLGQQPSEAATPDAVGATPPRALPTPLERLSDEARHADAVSASPGILVDEARPWITKRKKRGGGGAGTGGDHCARASACGPEAVALEFGTADRKATGSSPSCRG